MVKMIGLLGENKEERALEREEKKKMQAQQEEAKEKRHQDNLDSKSNFLIFFLNWFLPKVIDDDISAISLSHEAGENFGFDLDVSLQSSDFYSLISPKCGFINWKLCYQVLPKANLIQRFDT